MVNPVWHCAPYIIAFHIYAEAAAWESCACSCCRCMLLFVLLKEAGCICVTMFVRTFVCLIICLAYVCLEGECASHTCTSFSRSFINSIFSAEISY